MTTHTVFVVDDDEPVRESLRMLLGRRGLAVRCYASADAFMRQADLDDCGCLLIDHHMPSMTGIELLEMLRARRIATPAIIMTGGTDLRLGARAGKADALAVLEKPIVSIELLAWIELALAQSAAKPLDGSRAA